MSRGTMSLPESLTVGAGGVEPKTILPLQEVAEREIIARCRAHTIEVVSLGVRLGRWGCGVVH